MKPRMGSSSLTQLVIKFSYTPRQYALNAKYADQLMHGGCGGGTLLSVISIGERFESVAVRPSREWPAR